MRLTVKPENILEAIALKTRKGFQPFLLATLGMGVSQTLFTAVRLKVFDSSQENPKTAAELTKAIGGDAHGMQVLLESLDGFGFVQRQGDKYQLTRESARWLTGADDLFKDEWHFGGDINRQMVLLEEDIRTGEVPNFHFQPQSPTCFENYYTMLKSSGKQRSPDVLKWANLNPAPKRLLDVAGGPAEYSIAFCQQYPDLQTDILDLPHVVQTGMPRIEQAGLKSRIRYIQGNLLETDWGKDYDVVFLSNILHCLTEQQCQIAIAKSFQALRTGGKLIINDVFHPGRRGKLTSFISLFSLIYYVTCGGRIWSQPTLLEWLAVAGFTNLRTAKQRLALLVAGEKP